MLTHLQIKNFKAWKDTGKIRLAPLTIIFGANSAGKSSLGHLLLALKQTADSSDRKRALHLGDENSLIDLGTFGDCLHGHDLSKSLEFSLGWVMPKGMVVTDLWSKEKKVRYDGDRMCLEVVLKIDQKGSRPFVDMFHYCLFNKSSPVMDVFLKKNNDNRVELSSEQYKFMKADGRKWPLEDPEKFYRISDVTMARFRNAGFMADFALATEEMLSSVSYLGPLRNHPKRIYQWSGDTPSSVGQSGELTIAAILAAQGEGRELNRGSKQRLKGFSTFVAEWLRDLGVIHDFSVRPVAAGRKEYEVLVKTHDKAPEVKITDVGFGVSQVLPALVQAFYCPPNSTVWMEQPEIHLHPQVQAELADVFISAIKAREKSGPRNTQLIIESHSEHFLNRLQRRVAEDKITPEDIAVYFCRPTGSSTELESLELNEYGDIKNWPENFFGDEMADIAARTRAAVMRRRASGKSSSGEVVS